MAIFWCIIFTSELCQHPENGLAAGRIIVVSWISFFLLYIHLVVIVNFITWLTIHTTHASYLRWRSSDNFHILLSLCLPWIDDFSAEYVSAHHYCLTVWNTSTYADIYPSVCVCVIVICIAEHLILAINVWTKKCCWIYFPQRMAEYWYSFSKSALCSQWRRWWNTKHKSHSQHHWCGHFLDLKADSWSRTNVIKEGFTW